MSEQFKMNSPKMHSKFIVFSRLYIESLYDEVFIDGYNVKAGFCESEPGHFDPDILIIELEGNGCILRNKIHVENIQHVEFNDKVGMDDFIKYLWTGD